MKQYVLATFAVLAATPLIAQAPDEGITGFDAARAAVEANAIDLDTDGSGLIERDEMMSAAAMAFPAYDADASRDVSELEFKTAPFSFGDMAEIRGREQAYDAAFGLVFDIFDRDSDRSLSENEFYGAVARAFTYADINFDDALSRDEFLRGYIFNVAVRHAMRE